MGVLEITDPVKDWLSRILEVVGIAVVSLDDFAVFVGDSLDDSTFGLDVEGAGGADCNTSDVGSFLFSFGDFGFDNVTCLESEEYFLARASDSDTSEFVKDGTAAGAMSFASDMEHWHIPIGELCHISYASGVERVGFRDV
jgi:hypothetical protein